MRVKGGVRLPHHAARRGGWWWRHGWLVVGIAAAAALLVLVSTPWPYGLRISGNLVARHVSFQLDQALDASPGLALTPPHAVLADISWIEPPSGTHISAQNARLEAQKLLLAGFHAARGSRLELARQTDGALTLLAANGPASVDFEAGGPVKLVIGQAPSPELSTDAASGVSAGRSGSNAVPMAVTMGAGSAGGVVLNSVPASALRFGEPAGVPGAAFLSSIEGGSFTLVDTDSSTKLDPGTALIIDGFEGAILRLETVPGALKIGFAGRARAVSLGPAGFADSLTPSILDFLYHQHTVTMLWAAGAFVLGCVLRLRKWLSGGDAA